MNVRQTGLFNTTHALQMLLVVVASKYIYYVETLSKALSASWSMLEQLQPAKSIASIPLNRRKLKTVWGEVTISI
jgi:hypothetical protein